MSEKTIATKKQRNVAIELWRVIAAIAICGFHAGFIIARSAQGQTGYWMAVESKWFFGSSETLLIFTLTAGYFMYAHYRKACKNPEYLQKSATARAWEYTWARIKSLVPVLILGYVIGIAVSTKFYYPEFGLQEYLVAVVNSIWEFLGFHAAGLRNTDGIFFNTNGVLWFISAMIIGGYFLYWGLCKSEDFTAGFLAPFGFIFFAGWWCYTGTRAAQTAWSTFGLQTTSTNGMGGSATDATATLGFNNGFIFVMIGMLGGIIIYQLLELANKHEISKTGKMWLTIANVICSVLLGWYIIYQPTYFLLQRWTVGFLQIAVVGLTLYNKDGLTATLNNKYTSKLLASLGSISLYIYMLHYPVAIGVLRLLGKNTEATMYSFWQVYVPTIIVTIVLSYVTKYAMDKTILNK